ncbi:fatty acid synthase-like [Zophobas morio]|uniref:fatty acid synthase-like n=1 Tax=Zophobas morio TaxID=2755281 RepID=UPI0030835F12
MDKDVQFDPELAFYKQQLRKNLAVNILKNGKWGTYRHLPLDDVEEVESQHTFVTLGLKGQLNTLKWIEGPLTRQTKVKDGDILIYVGIIANMQKGNTELSISGAQQQKISNCLEVLDRFLQQRHPIVSSFVISTKRRNVSSVDGIIDVVADILGIKNIKNVDPNRLLTELEMDSMTATEIVQNLKVDLRINLTPDQLHNLTLKKVTEMEFAQKNLKSCGTERNVLTNVSKGSATNTTLTLSLPERSTAMTKILPSNIKGDINKKTVFILPSFDGCLQAFEPLANRVPGRVRGVLYNFNKYEETINDCARTILPHIEAHISKNEAFVIIGHLYGSIVGLEIVALLEEKGYVGNFISIEGSPMYMQTWLETNSFLSDQNKLQLFIISNLLTILTKDDVKIYMEKIALNLKLDEKLETAANFLPVDIDKQYFKDSVYVIYKRCSALIDYRFTHDKLISNVYLCKAKRPLVTGLKDDYSLSQLCKGFVQAGTVEEDYLKIISNEKCFDYLEKWLHCS